jgi:negative regulator of flagellin synthesis FlgM
MKIGQIHNTAAAAAVANNDRKAVDGQKKGAASSATATAESSTQVELSATASALSGEGTDPTFDSAKVERIAQAIRDGKFTVNHQAIADKLISNAQELLGRTGTSH